MRLDVNEAFVRWAAVIAGFVLAALGALGEAIAEEARWPLFVFIAGMLVLSTDFLAWLITRDADEAMIEYTPTGDTNWDHAVRMMNSVSPRQWAYDVSSIPNEDEFENAFIEKCRNPQITFWRIFAYDLAQQPSTEAWLRRMLDPGQDTQGRYQDVRDAIQQGRVQFLHYPHPIHTDFFVVDRRSQQGEMVLGFQKRSGPTYNTGIYSRRYRVMEDFRQFYVESIRDRAQEHLRDVVQGRGNCSLCSEFNNRQFETLLPK